MNEVNAFLEIIGYTPRSHPKDYGQPGRFYSRHAEKVLAVLHGADFEPIGVSFILCPDCGFGSQQNPASFFRQRSVAFGEFGVVADPTGVHVFTPWGSILTLARQLQRTAR